MENLFGVGRLGSSIVLTIVVCRKVLWTFEMGFLQMFVFEWIGVIEIDFGLTFGVSKLPYAAMHHFLRPFFILPLTRTFM